MSYSLYNCVTIDKQLADDYQLTYVVEWPSSGYGLSIHNGCLCLHACGTRFAPLCIDFLSGKLQHRRDYGGGRGQLIAKAVGIQTLKKPSILDVTAGLGQDAFILACLGARVIMVERSPILALLLQDGLKRFYESERSTDVQLSLIHADAKNYLQELTSSVDVIYGDPMYPDTNNTALNKKDMRVLRDIVGDDEDADSWFELALQKAKRRVVIKRPRQGAVLGHHKPNLVFTGKSSRFDVYTRSV